MNTSVLFLEAALRSVLLAMAVWIGLRVFNVRNVLAQKAAWGVVLASALAMPIVLPFAAHWSVLPASVRVTIPADPQNLLEELQARIQAENSPEITTPTPETPSGTAAPSDQDREELNAGAYTTAPATSIEVKDPDAGTLEYVPPQPAKTVAAAQWTHEPEAVSALPSTSKFPATIPPQSTTLSVFTCALLIYVAVSVVLLVRLLCGLAAAVRLWKRARPIPRDFFILQFGSLDPECCEKVRCSPDVSSPVTIGSGVVLPANFGAWDGEKLRVVLAHERSHIRQGDFYLQLLAGIYTACFWPSPLGWWLKRTLSDLAEAISDRAGLEQACDRASYAQILLEFAAAPRPTPIGVAMARSGSLSRRIERLLNDVSFSQAFAGTRRTLAAVVVLPLALFATTALVRVEAAGQSQKTSQVVLPSPDVVSPEIAPAQATPEAGQSQSEQVPEPASRTAAPGTPHVAPAPPVSDTAEPQETPGTPGAPDVAPVAPPHSPANSDGRTDLAPARPAHAPAPPTHAPRLMVLPGAPGHAAMTLIAPKAAGMAPLVVLPRLAGVPNHAMLALIAPRAVLADGRGYGAGQSASTESGVMAYSNNGKHSGYRYYFSSNGQSYAVIRGNDTEHMTFSGNWMRNQKDEIEKARKQAKGDFLWFTRDGKAYFVDDPGTLAQIEAMYKPMEDLGRQQGELGKKQEALGKQQEELGRQQEAVSVPTPDMSKEIAKIDEAMAKLKASQGKTMTQEEYVDLQERLGELQGRLGEIQGQIGSRQGEFGARMGELGAKMGALGEQQGKLGEEQGRLASEADKKVKSIIDESLKNGKAHPVQ